MSEFWTYFQIAWNHILDIKSYYHILIVIALITPYTFKEWKTVLVLLTILGVGEIVALFLAFFGVVNNKFDFAALLVPITILIAALFNFFTIGKSSKGNGINWISFLALFFGIIHGLAFFNYFNSVELGSLSRKMVPLLEYTIGIQVVQLVIALIFLILSYIIQNFFRFSKRDFILVCSSFTLGVVLPVIVTQVF